MEKRGQFSTGLFSPIMLLLVFGFFGFVIYSQIHGESVMESNSAKISSCLNGISNHASSLGLSQSPPITNDNILGCFNLCNFNPHTDSSSVLTHCYADIAIGTNNPKFCDGANDPKRCYSYYTESKK